MPRRFRFPTKYANQRNSVSSAALQGPTQLSQSLNNVVGLEEKNVAVDNSIGELLKEFLEMMVRDREDMMKKFGKRHQMNLKQKKEEMEMTVGALKSISESDELSLRLSQGLSLLKRDSILEVKGIGKDCTQLKHRLQLLFRYLVQKQSKYCIRLLKNAQSIIRERYNRSSDLVNRHENFIKELKLFIAQSKNGPSDRKWMRTWGLRAFITLSGVSGFGFWIYGYSVFSAMSLISSICVASQYDAMVSDFEKRFVDETQRAEQTLKVWKKILHEAVSRRDNFQRMMVAMDDLVERLSSDIDIADLCETIEEDEAKALFDATIESMDDLRKTSQQIAREWEQEQC